MVCRLHGGPWMRVGGISLVIRAEVKLFRSGFFVGKKSKASQKRKATSFGRLGASGFSCGCKFCILKP